MPMRINEEAMERLKNILLIFITLFVSSVVMAQDSADVDMADAMRASGKIYVVVAVLTLIFLGIVVYLIMLDRKITRLERELNNQS